jgi:pyruvate dehydrogenase E1 component
MGEAGEGQMITHQQKKMGLEALRKFRDRFSIPLSDAKIEEIPFLKLDEKERKHLEETRRALGGSLPRRRAKSASLDVPELSAFSAQLASTGDREISTTMAFVRIPTLLREKHRKFVVPIVPTNPTFGMEGMFRQFNLSQIGQLYKPQDADHGHREDRSGQI